MQNDFALFLSALNFSAGKHRHQRRKDEQASPYINHPIEVANVLWTIGDVSDTITIIGALLHDTIEDTNTTPEEIRTNFGKDVLALVLEVSDNKNLPKHDRKAIQIREAPYLSKRAKQLKLADKICNISDIVNYPPRDWSKQRKIDYLEWAYNVIDGLRGTNIKLETHFDALLAEGRRKLALEKG